jgi:hypothetical protein
LHALVVRLTDVRLLRAVRFAMNLVFTEPVIARVHDQEANLLFWKSEPDYIPCSTAPDRSVPLP